LGSAADALANHVTFEHTLTWPTRSDPSGTFDRPVQPDESFSFTFEEAGTYDDFCSFHSGMGGVIIVED
jgi:plastocyanin